MPCACVKFYRFSLSALTRYLKTYISVLFFIQFSKAFHIRWIEVSFALRHRMLRSVQLKRRVRTIISFKCDFEFEEC